MKKILILFVMLTFLSPGLCLAADPMLEKFIDMRLRLESGTNYRDYSTAYQNLYIDYKKSNTDKYDKLLELYKDFRDVWYNHIYEEGSFTYGKFMDKYPLTNNCAGKYFNVMPTLLCGLIPTAKELEK